MGGAWFSNDHFVTGWLSSTDANCAMVWLCGTGPVSGFPEEPMDPDDDWPISSMLYKRLLFRFNRTCFLRYLKVFSRPKNLSMPAGDRPDASQDLISLDHILPISTSPEEDRELAQMVTDVDMFVAFLCSSELTYVPHQVAFQNVTGSILDKTKTLDISDGNVVIEMRGHVVGMHVSPCQTQLYVNVRSWPENCKANFFTDGDSPVIAREVEVRVVDLHSFQVLRNVVYAGHLGLTPSNRAFYLYLNATQEYLCSGSEDGSKGGCVWDRTYKCLVAQLPHKECVNCVAVHPVNDEICVSASDDFTIGVWSSSNMVRQKQSVGETSGLS